jgi:CTP synthase (UTP-ammonia lyase)
MSDHTQRRARRWSEEFMSEHAAHGSTEERGVRIALIGDRRETVRAHVMIPVALEHAGRALSVPVSSEWIATRALGSDTAAHLLSPFDAIWCVPASPYENADGALAAIGFAREQRVPVLGTCGGFQHTVLEFARNVLGMRDAEHEESCADGKVLAIAALACALRGTSDTVHLVRGSRLATMYGRDTVEERFNCGFGVAPSLVSRLAERGFRVAATSGEGEVYALELYGHPFYLGTLFQPELSTSADRPSPPVQELVRMAAQHRSARVDSTVAFGY